MALYIEDKPMTKKEVCEFLDIPIHSIPTNRRRVIQMNTKIIDDKGTKRSAKSIGGKPEYSIFVPKLQREVKIRYAISQKKLKDDIFSYTPKTLSLIPAEDGSVLVNDDAQFMYWYLNPFCNHSPFKKPDAHVYYEYQDKNAEATKELQREEDIINAMSIIVGHAAWNDIQLKHLAKGMGVAGVDDMTPMVVKHHLKKLVHKDPIKFFNQANSREVIFTGKIQEAIDQNILILKSINGMQRWFLKEEEILPIQYGQEPSTELKQFMAEKWYLFADKINNALNGVTISSNLNNPINDEAFENEAKASGVQIKAEMTPEMHILLKEIKEKDWLQAKIEKLASYDVNDPTLHFASRKSYMENIKYIEAYKASQDTETLG
jgi:hypothetical protein